MYCVTLSGAIVHILKCMSFVSREIHIITIMIMFDPQFLDASDLSYQCSERDVVFQQNQ